MTYTEKDKQYTHTWREKHKDKYNSYMRDAMKIYYEKNKEKAKAKYLYKCECERFRKIGLD